MSVSPLAGIKDFLFLDFETYYAHTYTLRKMTTPEYLLDPKYETILCAVARNGEPSHIVEGPDFGSYIANFDPETTATVTFNALFDNAILAWHYGWVPKLMLDSMNMARALRGHILPKLNLETVCKVLGFPHDKSTILKVIDMRREGLRNNPALWAEFCDYANRDNERSRDIFKLLLPEFPQSEMKIMDLVIRCAVQPRLMLDSAHLKTHLQNVRAQKIKLLNACMPANIKLPVTASAQQIKAAGQSFGLMSAPQFQKTLEAFGVIVQTKPGANGTRIPCFAKTDTFMADLQEHPDSRVQALACARLGVKSTLEESRTERLIAIAALDWGRYRDGSPRLYAGGTAPIPLRYAGAHTHRLSGDWRLNMQNMPAGRGGKQATLRKGFVAPPGYSVVAGDLAQIEARLVAWLAGATDLLAEFAKPGGDPYSAFASLIFGFPVNRKYIDPVTGKAPHAIHGFIGKTGVLGLMYKCGDKKFYVMVDMLARVMGIDLASVIPWTRELAEKTVGTYRSKYYQIPALWERLQLATSHIWSRPGDGVMNIGPVTIRYAEIEGPNGLSMLYHNPRWEDGQWMYTYGWGNYGMYGGKMLENIIQFLARIIIMNAALRLNDLGYRFVLQAHDELVFVVPTDDVANAKKIIHRELVRRPSWGRDILLDAEIKHGPTYGDAK
jgi:DNA polymerase family A